MSFGLLSTAAVLIGLAALAIGLFIAQRLRVQHREVEVMSTLFWQAAIEETRARVFVRRFRHLFAWVLLVAIASLLWLLLAQPVSEPLDGTQHVVLLDWSVDDPELRESDLQLAIDRAGTLPSSSREIIAVGEHLETLLAAGEPVEYASLRAGDVAESLEPAAQGVDWAVESLSSRAASSRPLSLHLIGDVDLEQSYLRQLRPDIQVYRIPRESKMEEIRLTAFGVSDALSGSWRTVDVAIGIQSDSELDPASVRLTMDDQPFEQAIQVITPDEFLVADVPAGGGVLSVNVNGKTLGSLTLPRREPIRVSIEDGVPETLRALIEIDNACEVVTDNAELLVGFSENADLRLSPDDEPAFSIQSDDEDPNAALEKLIDALALRQIDAMAIAEQSGQVIDVQVVASEKRRIAIWSQLFTPSFDFAESRSCPILVARSMRWLAGRPALVPWVQQGDRLPAAAPEFDRAVGDVADSEDGRKFLTTRLEEPIQSSASLEESPAANLFARVGLLTWLGLIVSTLIAGEWMLYQRGRMP